MSTTKKVRNRKLDFQQVIKEVKALCVGETDEIALMATISCHLYQQIEGFDWVGFYRVVDKDILKIGPYQGCLLYTSPSPRD